MSCVEAYEESRQRQGNADFTHFLPPPNHPLYAEVATELMRVDMEYSWESGECRTVETYRPILHELLSDSQVLEALAYEEYRLTVQSGQRVTPELYAQRYAIDTSLWRVFSTDNSQKSDASHDGRASATIPGFFEEVGLLADEAVELPQSGDSVLNFHLEREIGRGAFARVFLARQGDLADRLVVLKFVSGSTLEPQHLARLQHTNIVPIYSVHRVNGLTAVCMPFIGQRTLSDVNRTLEQSDRFPQSGQAFLSTIRSPLEDTLKIPNTDNDKSRDSQSIDLDTNEFVSKRLATPQNYVDCIIRLVLQIAEGLSHAHQRGIVHRDLKPANILLTEDGLPLILDFNLSADIVVNGRASLLVGGTLPYMAPEHLSAIARGGKIGVGSDIFSLGVIFFELLTGKRPFSVFEGTFEEVVQRMILERRQPSPSARNLNPAIPRSVDAVVSRCLAADPASRYQSATDLCEDLRRHLDNLPLRHVPDRSLPERTAKWVRRHPRISSASSVATLSGAALLACLAIGIHWWAESKFQVFQSTYPLARTALSIPENDSDLIASGMKIVDNALSEYGVLSDPTLSQRLQLIALRPRHRIQLEQEFGELLYQLSEATIRKNDADAAEFAEALRLNSLARKYILPNQQPQAFTLQQATLLEKMGDVDQANQLRTLAMSREPEGPLDSSLKAQRLLLEQDYAEALPLLNELRDSSPTDPVYWLLLGNANTGASRLHEAEGAYSTAAALLPESYYPFFNRGLCRFDLHEFDAALDDFDKVLELQPGLPTCLLNRARVHAALGNHDQAVADFTEALDKGASQTRIYFLRARSLFALGDQKEAERDLAEGLRLTPTDAESWGARGIARLVEDPQAALEDFRQAVTLDPRSLQAWRNIVHVTADRLNQPEEALAALNCMLELDPNDHFALAGRAVLFARQGDRPAAIADVQRLLQLTQEPTYLFQAACALAHTSQGNEADRTTGLLMLTKAVMQDPALLSRAQSDPDLENLRKLDAFEQMIQSASHPSSKISPN
ncbi:protein kinase domain-containing protein [Bythopirellula polymerisocia]|nr:serine/threonine-protein kinase [Bythopirellula polymerisocia]